MASTSTRVIVQVPFRDRVTNNLGLLSKTWEDFFRLLQDLITPLGAEKSAQLENERTTETDIPGLSVSSAKVSFAIVEYLIQRVTVITNPVQLIEVGVFYLVYLPTENVWVKVNVGTPGPHNSGVTLTVTTKGQVQYTSTLVDGEPAISRINFRIRTLSGKSKLYSSLG